MHRVMDDLEKTVELMDLEELERREIRRREEEALKVIREREVQMKKEEEDKAATDDLMRKLSMLDSKFPRDPIGETIKLANQKQEQEQEQEQQQEEQQHLQQKEENIPPIYEDLSLPPPIPFSPVPPPSVESTMQPPPSAPPSYDELAPAAPSYDRIALSRHRSEYKLKTNKSTSYQAQSMRSLQETGKYSCNMRDALSIHMGNDQDDDGGCGSTAASCPLGPTPPSKQQQISTPPPLPPAPAPKVPFTTLRTACTIEYKALLSTKTVQSFTLSTYQGRITNQPSLDSTNGCAVISPLVAAYHLASPGSGIADNVIEQIIDGIAPPILNRVRKKLGLGALALIIPSDVHDFMVDEGILKQDKFVGVCGGNLLDGVHVKEFLDMMESNGCDNSSDCREEEKKKDEVGTTKTPSTTTNTSKVAQKVAATLFFHEHVVSIVKIVLPNGTSWFDIVDSLPQRQTNGVMGATRTRCKDRDSLRTVLFWYASNKFSQTDVQYIDSNEWNDAMCDLDPRVFQAFAWQE